MAEPDAKPATTKPKVLLILSGKRTSGTDYLERVLHQQLADRARMVSFRISSPIKREFARMHQLDYQELLTASAYKEQYRRQMVEWSEEIRARDPHHFLRLAIEEAVAESAQNPRHLPLVWILNDARRPADLQYFSETNQTGTKVITIRLVCSDQIRAERGWQFTAGIDDQTTECGLDSHQGWNWTLQNDGTREQLIEQMSPLLNQINLCL